MIKVQFPRKGKNNFIFFQNQSKKFTVKPQNIPQYFIYSFISHVFQIILVRIQISNLTLRLMGRLFFFQPLLLIFRNLRQEEPIQRTILMEGDYEFVTTLQPTQQIGHFICDVIYRLLFGHSKFLATSAEKNLMLGDDHVDVMMLGDDCFFSIQIWRRKRERGVSTPRLKPIIP